MIGIRSVTYNYGDPNFQDKKLLKMIKDCSLKWDSFHPHTQRINLGEQKECFAIDVLQNILNLCDESPVRWVNIPLNPFYKNNIGELKVFAYDLLSSSNRIFVNIIGVEKGVISQEHIVNYAKLVHDVGKIESTGLTNFRLGFSFNIEHDCPFFPFTRATDGDVSFSVALEMVQEINLFLKKTKCDNLQATQNGIVELLSEQINDIYHKALTIEKQSGIRFAGFDFSLAPEIGEYGSVITILEALGIRKFGHSGTMFATAFLTDILKEFANKFPSVGFSGVMYSVLEDLKLCSINNNEGIEVEQLIAVSTMCGCGLDMVPIYADTSIDEIRTLCMDIAAISCKYKKPLGVRLLSIPGTKKKNKVRTALSSEADFIANSKILELDINNLSNGKEFNFMRYMR